MELPDTPIAILSFWTIVLSSLTSDLIRGWRPYKNLHFLVLKVAWQHCWCFSLPTFPSCHCHRFPLLHCCSWSLHWSFLKLAVRLGRSRSRSLSTCETLGHTEETAAAAASIKQDRKTKEYAHCKSHAMIFLTCGKNFQSQNFANWLRIWVLYSLQKIVGTVNKIQCKSSSQSSWRH